MKNLWKFLFIPALLFSFLVFPVTVNSAETFSITTPDVSVNNNRLFQVDIFVDTNTSFSAGTFIITYDNNLIEYRGVSTNISTAICKAVDNKGSAKVIFLNTEKSFSKDKPIFSFEAKSLDYGACSVKVEAKDLVDYNGNSISITNKTQATITIDKKSSGGTVIKDTDTDIDVNNDNKATKNNKETEKESSVEIETKDAVNFSGKDDSVNMFFIYIIIFMLIVIVALIFICFYNMQAIKTIAKGKSQNDKDPK